MRLRKDPGALLSFYQEAMTLDDRRKALIAEIEQLRRQLENLIEHKGLSSPEVIELSQKIDALVNEYTRLPGGARE
jgi:hypothetical protein